MDIKFASDYIQNPHITLLRMPDRDALVMRFGCQHPDGIIYCSHEIDMHTLRIGKYQTIQLTEMVIMNQVFDYLYKEHGNGD